MREIKFRAWEKNLKEMIPVDNIDFEKRMINTESAWRLFDEIELMQFTGLKDKNGNEIYESDVLEVEKSIFNKNRFQLRVKHIGAGFALVHPRAHNTISLEVIPWYVNQTAEVIGNIYENPELLEKER